MSTTITPSVGNAPSLLQAGVGASPGYDAVDFRRMSNVFSSEGVESSTAWAVTENSPAGMSVIIDADVDGALIEGDSVTDQGMYYCPPHTSDITETITAADATNPRNDLIVLEVLDDTHDGSTSNTVQTRVIDGTPTAGAAATDALGVNGTPTLPDTAIALAVVNVPATATEITQANIDDRRPVGAVELGDGSVETAALADGAVTSAKLATGQKASDILGAWHVHQAIPLMLIEDLTASTHYYFEASSSTGSHQSESGSAVTTEGIAMVDIDSAALAVSGLTPQMRVVAMVTAETGVTSVTFTPAIYPVTFSSSGGELIATLGAAVIFGANTQVFSNEKVRSAGNATSLPAADTYAFGFFSDATTGAGESYYMHMQLQIRYV